MKKPFANPILFPVFLLTVILLSGCSAGQNGSMPRTGSVPAGVQVLPQDQSLQAESTAVVQTALLQASQAPENPQGLNAGCLVGAWEVENLANALEESRAQSNSLLAVEGVVGNARYIFSDTGGIEIQYNRLTTHLSGVVKDRQVTAVQVLDGSATAEYELSEGSSELVFSGFGGEGVTFTLSINGQQLVEGNLPAWNAFTQSLSGNEMLTPGPLIKHSRAVVECSGNQMTLRTMDPVPGLQIDLHRLE